MRPLDPESRWFIVLLGSLTALTALSIDMSLPALPFLTKSLQIPADRAQLTLSLFLLGFAIGQLVVGPASDRFGRRPVLLWGLLAFTLAGAGCARSQGIEALILCRFLQGMTACVGPVLGRAVVRDHFSAERAAALLSSLTVVLAVAPLVAPMIGGQLLDHFTWHAIFWALSLAGLALFGLAAAFLGESLSPENRQIHGPAEIAGSFALFLRNRESVAHALIICFVFGAQFAYISGSPFVVIEVFGVPPHHYGLFFGATAICLIVGASANGRLLREHTPARLLRTGLFLLASAGGALSLIALLGGGMIATLIPLMLFFFALGIVTPNATAAALQPMGRRAGVASALLGVFQMAGGAVAGWTVSAFYDHSARPMSFAVGALSVAALLARMLLVVAPSVDAL